MFSFVLLHSFWSFNFIIIFSVWENAPHVVSLDKLKNNQIDCQNNSLDQSYWELTIEIKTHNNQTNNADNNNQGINCCEEDDAPLLILSLSEVLSFLPVSFEHIEHVKARVKDLGNFPMN